MTTMYVLTTGCYSDYHIVGVFSTKEKAEAAKVDHNLTDGDGDVEEWGLDAVPEHPPGLHHWCVRMDRDGNTLEARRRGNDSFPSWEWAPYGVGYSDKRGGVSFNMWAGDERHAVKIANEKRIGLLASGQWTEDWNEWRARSS
jgi:hypothetical protein